MQYPSPVFLLLAFSEAASEEFITYCTYTKDFEEETYEFEQYRHPEKLLTGYLSRTYGKDFLRPIAAQHYAEN